MLSSEMWRRVESFLLLLLLLLLIIIIIIIIIIQGKRNGAEMKSIRRLLTDTTVWGALNENLGWVKLAVGK
jgi:ABC-type sulfate transport system permease component